MNPEVNRMSAMYCRVRKRTDSLTGELKNRDMRSALKRFGLVVTRAGNSGERLKQPSRCVV